MSGGLSDDEREALLCDCMCDGAHADMCATRGEYDLLLGGDEVIARVEALLAARAVQPTPSDKPGERDYHGHPIGEDGLVEGPGGQRLKPVEDPWPGINAQRQQDGGA